MNKKKVTSYKFQFARKCKCKRLSTFHFSLSTSSGFTLIEVVIYIAIFSMIVVTLVSLAYVSAREDRETINNVLQAYEDNI